MCDSEMIARYSRWMSRDVVEVGFYRSRNIEEYRGVLGVMWCMFV